MMADSIGKSGYRQLSALWLVAMLFMVLGLLAFHWYLEREELIGRIRSEAAIVNTNAGAALVFNDAAAAAEILMALRHSDSILEAALYRADGRRLAVYRRDGAAPGAVFGERVPAGELVISLREIRMVVPVILNARSVGMLALRLSQDHLYQELTRFFLAFIVIALATTALAYVATARLRRRIAETERARQETEGRLQNLAGLLPITLFHLAGQEGAAAAFRYVSEGASQLLGISAERLLAAGRALTDVVVAEDAGMLSAVLTGTYPLLHLRHGFSWSGRIRHPARGEIWIEIRATADVGPGGTYVLNGAMMDVSELKRYQRDLEESRLTLRQMIAHRENILEEEHKRIALEIHDQLGQILTAAMMNLRLLERSLVRPDAEVSGQIEDIRSQLNEAYDGMKNIAASLHPAVLQFGLVPAIEWLAERILKVAGVRWRIETADARLNLDPHSALMLFRIVQESLTNVARHAGATSVRIALAVQNDELVAEVADNGRGIDKAAGDGRMKFGLTGMRERAESVGGHVAILETPGGGTCIRAAIPLPADDAPSA